MIIMIPKIIHYCWFGHNKKSELIKNCIKSWKKFCPDYEIKEWNEDNFDIFSNTYAKEAYENKKWAFVADYVRVCVLQEYGGIYLDTDMEILKPLDNLLNKSGFIGFESKDYVAMGIIGVEKNNHWINEFAKQYQDRHFMMDDGKLDLSTNVALGTKLLKELYHLELNGEYINIKNVMEIFPIDYFYPKDFYTGKMTLTENTITIHHYDNSWYSKIEKKLYHKKLFYIQKYDNQEKGEEAYQKWYKRNKLFIHIRKFGIIPTLKSILKRINLGLKQIFS